MTPTDNPETPDVFAPYVSRSTSKSAVPKKKAGFYFSEALLERFNRKFHRLKLDGVPVENKSMLAEMALGFALDDLDRGTASQLMKELTKR